MRDFILAMNLLARITYDKKLKLLFELCDDDDDGCMTPEDILQMFMRVERQPHRSCQSAVDGCPGSRRGRNGDGGVRSGWVWGRDPAG